VSRSFAFDVLLGLIHGFRMPLFFLLAGFFAHLLWQRSGTRGFLVHRALRVGLPFAIGMVTIVPAILALWRWAQAHPTAARAPMLGEPDMMGQRFFPAFRAVAYFGLFFAVGWWLHRRSHALSALREWLKSYFAAALVAFLVLGACHFALLRPGLADSTLVKLVGLS